MPVGLQVKLVRLAEPPFGTKTGLVRWLRKHCFEYDILYCVFSFGITAILYMYLISLDSYIFNAEPILAITLMTAL